MQLLYVLHHDILETHAIPPGLTILLLIGALYGALRLAWDLFKLAGALLRAISRTSWRVQMTPGRSPREEG